MKVIAKLKFRECKQYTNEKGESKLRVRFLDEDDNPYNLFYYNNEENKKFIDMKKDTPCDVEINIFKSNKGNYAMYVR